MFQFIIARSSEPLSICLISSGQLKMEFRLEAACKLIFLHSQVILIRIIKMCYCPL